MQLKHRVDWLGLFKAQSVTMFVFHLQSQNCVQTPEQTLGRQLEYSEEQFTESDKKVHGIADSTFNVNKAFYHDHHRYQWIES